MKTYSNEELAVMDESDLYRHFHKIKSILSRNRSNRTSDRKLETYYCYVSREIQIRQQRREYSKNYEEKRRYGKQFKHVWLL